MTTEELHEKYGFKELTKSPTGNITLNPIYKKWLPACWIIEDVYGSVENGTMSLGKARELTAAIIEEHFRALESKP